VPEVETQEAAPETGNTGKRRLLTRKQVEREKERKLREHTPDLLDGMFEAIKKKLKAGDPGIIQMTAKMMKYLEIGPQVQIQNNNQILNASGGRGGGRGSGARSFESIVAALDSRERAAIDRPASDVRAIEAPPPVYAEFEDISSADSQQTKAEMGEGSGGGRTDPAPGRERGDVGSGEEARESMGLPHSQRASGRRPGDPAL
jgi:hypothetical protein